MNIKKIILLSLAALLGAGLAVQAQTEIRTANESGAQPALILEQKKAQGTVWAELGVQQVAALRAYEQSCAHLAYMYQTIAVSAIKKYGIDQEKETAAIMTKDIRKPSMEMDASWKKIVDSSGVLIAATEGGWRWWRGKKVTDENVFEDWKKEADDFTVLFNTESETIFKSGQTLVQYHQTATAILDRIVAELNKNPKTQAAAKKLEQSWEKELKGQSIPKVTHPMNLDPFVLKPEVATSPAVVAQDQKVQQAASNPAASGPFDGTYKTKRGQGQMTFKGNTFQLTFSAVVAKVHFGGVFSLDADAKTMTVRIDSSSVGNGKTHPADYTEVWQYKFDDDVFEIVSRNKTLASVLPLSTKGKYYKITE